MPNTPTTCSRCFRLVDAEQCERMPRDRHGTRCVDLDAHGLANQIDRQHEARVRALAHQTAHDALERTVYHLDHHALVDERARIVRELTLDQCANTSDLVLGYGCEVTIERHDGHHAGTVEHR